MSTDPLALEGSSPDEPATVQDCQDDYAQGAEARAAFDAECQN